MDEFKMKAEENEQVLHESKPLDDESIEALRQRRINDLLHEALNKTDPWAANHGAAASGLLRVGYKLEKMIERHLDSAADPIKGLSQCSYALESYFKSMRQADRFAQLGNRRGEHQNRQGDQKPA